LRPGRCGQETSPVKGRDRTHRPGKGQSRIGFVPQLRRSRNCQSGFLRPTTRHRSRLALKSRAAVNGGNGLFQHLINLLPVCSLKARMVRYGDADAA